jgi:hypothetical protein
MRRAAARPEGMLLAHQPELACIPAVKAGCIATAGTPIRTARRRPHGGSARRQPRLPATGCWRRCGRAALVEGPAGPGSAGPSPGGRGTAWRQPSRAPRQTQPAETVVARCVWDGAALHRPLAAPEPVQLCRQRPGAVLQIQQVTVAVERLALDTARPTPPITGLRVHGRGSSGLSQQLQWWPLSNPELGAMVIAPGRRGFRPLTRCYRPRPGCQAPTNPPRRRARPSRSRMAHAHRTSRRWGLPGTVWVQPAVRRRDGRRVLDHGLLPAHQVPARLRPRVRVDPGS